MCAYWVAGAIGLPRISGSEFQSGEPDVVAEPWLTAFLASTGSTVSILESALDS